jgi:hypothetical protein
VWQAPNVVPLPGLGAITEGTFCSVRRTVRTTQPWNTGKDLRTQSCPTPTRLTYGLTNLALGSCSVACREAARREARSARKEREEQLKEWQDLEEFQD